MQRYRREITEYFNHESGLKYKRVLCENKIDWYVEDLWRVDVWNYIDTPDKLESNYIRLQKLERIKNG